MKEKINFDMESAIQVLREGKDISGKNAIFTPLIKQLIEAAYRPSLRSILRMGTIPIVKMAVALKKP